MLMIPHSGVKIGTASSIPEDLIGDGFCVTHIWKVSIVAVLTLFAIRH
jgi:hypothetical protein